MKFIQYNLFGKIIKQYSCEFDQLKDNPIGEKVRITMNDGRVHTGFWDTFIDRNTVKIVKISQFDLNEKTSKLRSFNSIVMPILTNKIAKLEVILHSNPRWGTRPTNKFEFFKPVNKDINKS